TITGTGVDRAGNTGTGTGTFLLDNTKPLTTISKPTQVPPAAVADAYNNPTLPTISAGGTPPGMNGLATDPTNNGVYSGVEQVVGNLLLYDTNGFTFYWNGVSA